MKYKRQYSLNDDNEDVFIFHTATGPIIPLPCGLFVPELCTPEFVPQHKQHKIESNGSLWGQAAYLLASITHGARYLNDLCTGQRSDYIRQFGEDAVDKCIGKQPSDPMEHIAVELYEMKGAKGISTIYPEISSATIGYLWKSGQMAWAPDPYSHNHGTAQQTNLDLAVINTMMVSLNIHLTNFQFHSLITL